MGWEVEVRVDGEPILTIGDWGVAGVVDAELEKHADRIRDCAEHLRAFIGSGEPTPCFACGDTGQERWVGHGGTEEVGPCSVCQPTQFICPVCGGNDDDRQLMCEACGGAGWLGEHYDPTLDDTQHAGEPREAERSDANELNPSPPTNQEGGEGA